MDIKHSIRFSIKKNGQIICRVKYGKASSGRMQKSIDLYIGYYGDTAKWDAANQCALRGTTHKVGKHSCTAAQINRTIHDYNDVLDMTIRYFEGNGFEPDTQTFKQILNTKMVECGIKEEKPQPKVFSDLNHIDKALDAFITEGVTLKGWQASTSRKFITLQYNLKAFRKDLKLSDLNVDIMQLFQTFLINKRSKKDETPYHNSTINADFKRFRWFLRWCKAHDLISDDAVVEYNPKLKDTENKEVIFLTYDEFMQLYNYQPPTSKQHLIHTKDLFVFQCSTGMRYSDMSTLKRSQIANGFIKFTTVKTTHALTIKINRYAKEVLDKYAGQTYENDLALPVISNKKMNTYLKELCKLAGIDELITMVYKNGGKRIENTAPKYELIGTHSARRTFVSVALSLGASAEQVSTITGHHSYAVMKRYIGLSDADRNKATEVWDNDDAHKTKYIEHIKSFSLDTLHALATMTEEQIINLLYK